MHSAVPAPVRPDVRRSLLRLTDATGLLEHANRAQPRTSHGYCVDDNARAIVVVERALRDEPQLQPLYRRYVRFVLAGQAGDGRWRNRFSHRHQRWIDPPGTGDWWGRALWAVGRVAARPVPDRLTRRAAEAFEAGSGHRSEHPRAMAYAALGCAAVLEGAPTARQAAIATALLHDAIVAIGTPRPGSWAWPEPRLTYANARLPEALIAAGHVLRDPRTLRRGLALLSWLVDVETAGTIMSFTPVGGRGPGETGPAFDQQPIEAWSMASAAERAYIATGDSQWLEVVARCDAWFAGANDAAAPLAHPSGRGGYDGLTIHGPNENQGAESTLSWIATSQSAASCLQT